MVYKRFVFVLYDRIDKFFYNIEIVKNENFEYIKTDKEQVDIEENMERQKSLLEHVRFLEEKKNRLFIYFSIFLILVNCNIENNGS